MVALIPARAGSKRIPGKNTKLLAGHPLIAYTIAAVIESNVFQEIHICSDDEIVFDMVQKLFPYRTASYRRPIASDAQPDIEWVRLALEPFRFEQFAILRPTSPFRTAAMIRRAYDKFRRTPDVHSLRAVEPVKQHPGKMWWCNGPGYPLTPVCDAKRSDGTPWHSSPTQTLPPCYIQNASLEMAWTSTVKSYGTISGTKVLPFFTEGYEGFDLNTMDDWREAERLIAEGLVELPSLPLAGV